jgi:DnaA family protein
MTPSATLRQRVLNIQPEAEPRFDNFLPGDNLETLLALHTLASGELRERIVYCWGPEGSGRTHLLQASVGEAQRHGRRAVYCAPGVPPPDEMPDLLALDCVERLDAVGQVALFSRINSSREGTGAVLVTGGSPPAQLPVRPDLASRLAWGLVFTLHPLNEADRATAMRERAAARGLELPDEVLRYMLGHCRRDLPSLLATVDALDEVSLSLKRPLTVPLLRDYLNATTTREA